MEEEGNIIVKWAQEDVETSYNLLNIYIYVYIYIYKQTNVNIYCAFAGLTYKHVMSKS